MPSACSWSCCSLLRLDGCVAVPPGSGVVKPGDALFNVAPLPATPEIETMVQNKDIGFVAAGQRATVRFDAFPSRATARSIPARKREGAVRVIVAGLRLHELRELALRRHVVPHVELLDGDERKASEYSDQVHSRSGSLADTFCAASMSATKGRQSLIAAIFLPSWSMAA